MNNKDQRIRPSSPHGFTLPEILAFIVAVTCTLLGIVLTLDRIGGIPGLLLGGFFGLAAFFVGLLIWALLRHALVGTGLPRCRDGCCRAEDYKIQKYGNEYYWTCPQRGIRYKRVGKRFVIVNDDRTETPYLIWRSFRGWFPEVNSTRQP